MYLYIQQKVFSIGDKYNIFDANQEPVYAVESEIFTFGARIHLYNLAGYEEFGIYQKVFRFMPEYEICKGDTLYAVVTKKFTFFSHRLEIHSSFGDMEIEGEPFGMEFSIIYNGKEVGRISKRWFTFGDSYELYVEDHQDPAFFCALVVAIDHCIHNENRS